MKRVVRARSARALTKKSLTVDERAVRASRGALKAASDSEAVQIAVRDRLWLEEAEAAGIDDVFRRGVSNARKTAG